MSQSTSTCSCLRSSSPGLFNSFESICMKARIAPLGSRPQQDKSVGLSFFPFFSMVCLSQIVLAQRPAPTKGCLSVIDHYFWHLLYTNSPMFVIMNWRRPVIPRRRHWPISLCQVLAIASGCSLAMTAQACAQNRSQAQTNTAFANCDNNSWQAAGKRGL